MLVKRNLDQLVWHGEKEAICLKRIYVHDTIFPSNRPATP